MSAVTRVFRSEEFFNFDGIETARTSEMVGSIGILSVTRSPQLGAKSPLAFGLRA